MEMFVGDMEDRMEKKYMDQPDPGEIIEPGNLEKSHSPEGSANPADEPSPSFPVVGIGASAGGLESFEQFFTGLPPDTGMAFVLIQHLSPPHKSILPEIIHAMMQAEEENEPD